jgi:hypothetical protein
MIVLYFFIFGSDIFLGGGDGTDDREHEVENCQECPSGVSHSHIVLCCSIASILIHKNWDKTYGTPD